MSNVDGKFKYCSHVQIHDASEWLEEAQSIIADVKECVSLLEISNSIPVTDQGVHLNLTTFENEKFTIQLSASGFRVVGDGHDCVSAAAGAYFETPYSLLDTISPMYRAQFCNALSQRLQAFASQQNY